jgi:hypothetical protein
MFDSGASVGEISGCSKQQLSCSVRQQRPYKLTMCGEDCDIQFFNGVPFKWEKRVENKVRGTQTAQELVLTRAKTGVALCQRCSLFAQWRAVRCRLIGQAHSGSSRCCL